MKQNTEIIIESFLSAIGEQERLGFHPTVSIFKGHNRYSISFGSEKMTTQVLDLSNQEYLYLKSLAGKFGLNLRQLRGNP